MVSEPYRGGVSCMKTQWQIYRQLELIPDGVSLPSSDKGTSTFYKSKLWKKLVTSCSQHLSDQQKISHLKTCFQLDYSDPHITEQFHLFQTIWRFLNQPIQFSEVWQSSEPYVWKSYNFLGHIQWHIYDPKNGKTYDLNSEEEVVVWFEKRKLN